jgi:hypothetical protein
MQKFKIHKKPLNISRHKILNFSKFSSSSYWASYSSLPQLPHNTNSNNMCQTPPPSQSSSTILKRTLTVHTLIPTKPEMESVQGKTCSRLPRNAVTKKTCSNWTRTFKLPTSKWLNLNENFCSLWTSLVEIEQFFLNLLETCKLMKFFLTVH